MTEWDKANKKIYKAIYHDRMLKDVASAYCELKAVGDELQKHNEFLISEIDNYSLALNTAVEQLEAIRKLIEDAEIGEFGIDGSISYVVRTSKLMEVLGDA